jgi:aspartyl-tRNA(Asn)/glutamyl-tRNA(Gln) amidotransferase subunit B
MLGDLSAALNRRGETFGNSASITPSHTVMLLDLISDGTINGRIAKEVIEIMAETGQSPLDIVESKGLRQVTDTGAIDTAVERVLAANADKVADYRAGKERLFGFFVGQVMKAMAGKGNPALVNETLKKKLS